VIGVITTHLDAPLGEFVLQTDKTTVAADIASDNFEILPAMGFVFIRFLLDLY
jgi:hypothetical protein